MSLQFIIIFFGLFILLMILLIIFRILIRRLKINRRSQSILFIIAILICFLIVSFLRKPWFELFEDYGTMTKKGEVANSIHYFKFDFTLKGKKEKITIEKRAGQSLTAKEIDQITQLADEEVSSKDGARKSLVDKANEHVYGGGVESKDPSIRVINVKDWVDRSFTVIPILILAFLINSLIVYFFWEGAMLDEEGEPMVPKLLRQLSAALIYLIALTIVIGVTYPKVLSTFLAAVGTSGAIAAFLAQEPIKQAFTALSLNINKKIRRGDIIEIDGYLGEVKEIGWKSIKLETTENNELSVPNTTLVNSIFMNHSRPERFRQIDIEIQVRADVSPRKAIDLFTRAALDSDYVTGEPKVNLVDIRFTRARYLIEIFTTEDDVDVVKGQVLSAIWYMMRRENLHPSYRNEAVEHPIDKAKGLLNSVPIFAPFTDEEDEELAKNAEWVRYGWPERVVIEGETDFALFIVAEGSLEVLIKQEDGTMIKVADLPKNAIFGERALLTGEPRKATVRATSDVLLLKISKQAIRPILYKRKGILEELSQELAEREMENQKKKEAYEHEAEQNKKKSTADKLYGLMVNFFKEEDEKQPDVQDVL